MWKLNTVWSLLYYHHICWTIPTIWIPAHPFWNQQLSWYSCSLQVSKMCWHMIHYGGPTPKKHYALSNSPDISKLNLGKFCMKKWLKKKQELEKDGRHQKLVEHYIDSKGKKRWKGTKALRSNEWGTYLFQSHVKICFLHCAFGGVTVLLTNPNHRQYISSVNTWEPYIVGNLINSGIELIVIYFYVGQKIYHKRIQQFQTSSLEPCSSVF